MKKDYLVNFKGVDFNCVDAGFGNDEIVDVVVRPEDIKIVMAEEGMLTGQVESVTFKGVHYEIMVQSEGYTWMVHSTAIAHVGDKVGMVIVPEDIHIMKRR